MDRRYPGRRRQCWNLRAVCDYSVAEGCLYEECNGSACGRVERRQHRIVEGDAQSRFLKRRGSDPPAACHWIEDILLLGPCLIGDDDSETPTQPGRRWGEERGQLRERQP